MWIAKPIAALTGDEARRWSAVTAERRKRDPDTPLAQTLTWARAAEATGARAWVVFSTDEPVGGILLGYGDELDCVNGPLIDWADPDKGMRQLATFAQGASKMVAGLARMELHPRWPRERASEWSQSVPLEIDRTDLAATRILGLEAKDSEQIDGFSPRLKRTLRQSLSRVMDSGWEPLDAAAVDPFLERMADFARDAEVTIPPQAWFAPFLTDGSEIQLWRAWASLGVDGVESASAEVVIALYGSRAHYLFGYQRRADGAPGALSASAVAQFLAIRGSHAAGAETYDFNGWIEKTGPDHPYAGVNAFKEQFGGEVLAYSIPRFVIEA
ncbi:MAG TPA: hypothetical protein VL588_01950 [Bdellovibrionota bacterium]|jgi:hypothetical protein|nr:hypothetical protein [Bdellovibrionota bacterium]